MENITTMKPEIKSGSMLKTCMMGLVAAAAFGSISLPAHAQNAADTNQSSAQANVQHGNGNVGVNTSRQTADVKQGDFPWLPGKPNVADTNQSSAQANVQHGNGNVGVNTSEQRADVKQGDYHYPVYLPF